MARGVSRKPIPYVLESDRGLDPVEQTKWWIVARKPADDALTFKRYKQAMPVRRGQERVDTGRWVSADKEELTSFCKKVENFYFSGDFLDAHPEMQKRCNEHGAIPALDTVIDIAYVYDDMQSDHYTELVEVSKSLERLTESEKKDLNSHPTSATSDRDSKAPNSGRTTAGIA